MKLIFEPLEERFSICKVTDYSGVNPENPFCFLGATDEEKSLVCPEELVPQNSEAEDKGWKGFRIAGKLDFSLVGILAKISGILADHGIGIFAISTFNTDYVFVKEENFEKAMTVLDEQLSGNDLTK